MRRCFPVKRHVRRAFERAARTYDEAAVLQREVCARLLEHLDPIRLAPRRAARSRLRHRARVRRAGAGAFPAPLLLGVDIAPAMLARARARRAVVAAHARLAAPGAGLRGRRAPARSPARRSTSSSPTSRCSGASPSRVFAEAARVARDRRPLPLLHLRAGHAAGSCAPRSPRPTARAHVNRFIDMHDLGDALVHAGFADPVMEMETDHPGVRHRPRRRPRPEGDRRGELAAVALARARRAATAGGA